MISKLRELEEKMDIKKLAPILILIATSLMGIAYAVVNGVTIEITGNISAVPQNSIFITDVVYKSGNNVYKELSEINNFYQTMLNSKVVLGETQDSSITYTITFYNKNDYDMYYRGIYYDEIQAFYSNNEIEIISSIPYGTVINKKDYLSFDITFKYLDGITPTNFELLSYINFKFSRIHDVVYEGITINNYPPKAFDKEPFDLTFTKDIPQHIEVSVGGVKLKKDEYTYSNSVLHINQVTGNVLIKKIATISEVILLDNKITEGCPKTSSLSSNYVEITDNLSGTDTPKEQFCQTQDDYGPTYYYRGATQNNYVYFADNLWRIMRINGDNSIRLILNSSIGTSSFTANATENADVGYLSGEYGKTSYNATHTNSNETVISNFINNWYQQIIEKRYAAYVKDTYFCNDRSVNDGVHGDYRDIVFNPNMANYCLVDANKNKVCRGQDTARGYGNETTYYGAWYKFVENIERKRLQDQISQEIVAEEIDNSITGYATYKCFNKNDRLTTEDDIIGTGVLKYPISLPSADDIVLAGVTYSDIAKNPVCYLATPSAEPGFWTMSPGSTYGSFNSSMCTYLYTGWMACEASLTSTNDVRPVINIKGSAEIISGNGTKDNPYVINTPYVEYNIAISENTNVTASYLKANEGRRIEIKSAITDKAIESFKINGKIHKGTSFLMPASDVVISDINYVDDGNNI